MSKYFMTVCQHGVTGEIEVRFDQKPESPEGQSLIARLKEVGFRWHMERRAWYITKDLAEMLDDSCAHRPARARERA